MGCAEIENQVTHYISFPGVGIEPFPVNRVAFQLFGKNIYWYGVIICLGIILAVAYVCMRAKKSEGIVPDTVIDYALVVVPFAIICARLYYVLTSLDKYESFLDAIAIWNGGLAIYGAIIGGFVAVAAVSRYKRIHLGKILDAIAPAVLIGQILGRWGNFFNAEAYGVMDKIVIFSKEIPTPGLAESFPLRMVIEDEFHKLIDVAHPTFLYESVWNIIGFILLNLYYKKKKFDGEIVLMYLSWYGFGRFFIEGLRGDSLFVGNIKISQLVGFLCFVGCSAAVVILRRRKKNVK